MAIGPPQLMRDEANREPGVVETRGRTQDATREMRVLLVRRGWLTRGWLTRGRLTRGRLTRGRLTRGRPRHGWLLRERLARGRLLVIRPRQGEQKKGPAPEGSRPFPVICIALAHSRLRAWRFPTARAQSSRHRPRRVRPSTAHPSAFAPVPHVPGAAAAPVRSRRETTAARERTSVGA